MPGFKPIDEIPGRKGRPSKAEPLIQEFLKSKTKYAEVDQKAWGGKKKVDPVSIVTSLRTYITNNKSPVKVIVREGNIYLEKVERPRARTVNVRPKKPIKRKGF